MDFSIDFFRDEVRHGFYIPTAIKQSWAASLTVLSEIDRICEKYGITYFADWGTILGAVRHGGFVPWDDDLDICMKRDDYIRFREVADRELPEEYVIHDYERKENHWLFLSRVVNNSKTCFTRKHLDKYHNFPYMCAVDIFIQDYLYDDPEKERERCGEIKRLVAVADGIVEGRFSPATIESELSAFEDKYGVSIERTRIARDYAVALYKIAEKQMARVKREDSDRVGQIFPWILKGGTGLPKKYYEKIVRLPFENTTVPVPAYYNEVLKSRYGNYLQILKFCGGHDYPHFEKQREQLIKASGYTPEEFTFTQDMLVRGGGKNTGQNQNSSVQRMSGKFIEEIGSYKNKYPEDSYKYTVIECMEQLAEMTGQLISMYKEEMYEEVLSLLPECQQLAVDMGTYIEQVKSEEMESTKLTVCAIQEYCDLLYGIYQEVTGEDASPEGDESRSGRSSAKGDYEEEVIISDKGTERGSITNETIPVRKLKNSVSDLEKAVCEQIIERKEILFLTIGPKEWRGFSKIYKAYEASGQADVYVIPLPLFLKDSLGRIVTESEENVEAPDIEGFPEELVLTPWNSYDVKLHQPDKIFIQNPYDGENPCLTVPPTFYAKNLRDYTDELIYVPAFDVDEFGKDNYNDLYNMKHYVTAPGIIYADRVIVQSDNMKRLYVNKLTEFAGEDTRHIWEERLQVRDVEEVVDGGNRREEKKIVYCIGLNEMSEHQDNIIQCIRDRLDIFECNRNNIDVTVIINPADINEWNKIDEVLTEELFAMIEEYRERAEGERGQALRILDMKQADYNSIVQEHDAYYGSASPLVPMFNREKKPVMISGY